MQKIKKGGLWLVVATLILPNVFAYTIPYFDTNEIFMFYQQNYLFVDFILAWMLFGSIARIFVEKKFGGDEGGKGHESPSIKPLYLSMGLILALGIVGLEMQYPGYSFLNAGPLSFLLIVVLMGSGIYELVQQKQGEEKKLSWAKILLSFGVLTLLLGWLFPTQLSSFSMPGFLSALTPDSWLSVFFYVTAAIVIWLFFGWLYRTGKARLAGSNEQPPRLLQPNRVTGGGAQPTGTGGQQPPSTQPINQGQSGQQPANQGGNQPTPHNILEQLTRVRATIEAFLAYVSRIETPGMTITADQSQRLVELFKNARFEIRTLLQLRNYNQISAHDNNILMGLLRNFANGIIISRGFRAI